MKTTISDMVDEKTTPVLTGTLKSGGVAIPLAQIATVTLTLYNRATETIINSRNAQDVKNANNVTIHSTSGLLTWSLQPADTAIEDSGKAYEWRVAQFTWTFESATKTGRQDIHFCVRNLAKVT